MSALQRVGAIAWITDKLTQVKEAGEIALKATDPATREQAAFDAATKLAETVGIGIPLWFLDKALTKTGFDRVFDSLRKNKSFQEYLNEQVSKKNIRDFGIGTIAEWGLKEVRELISGGGYLDPLFDAISPTVNTATTGALALDRLPPVVSCPLVLDLDGGGISNSGIEPGLPILFDHDGDGLRNATGWVGAGEAIVVRDLNGNGTIDSGLELFGDNTLLTRGPKAGQRAANGFEALADLDSTNDGQFNAADAAFASVKLWKDANQNGISEAGELFTFAQLGVQGIKVSGWVDGTRLTDADGELTGNRQILAGTFTWGNGGNGQAGTTGLAADLTFTNNAFYRKFSDDPTPTAAALALPNMQGSGLVRDLRAAAEALRER